MVLAAVVDYFRRAGWTVLERPAVGDDAPAFRPDVLLQRRGHSKALLVRDQPPGLMELARFAAQCKRNGLEGIVVGPLDPATQEACDLHGVGLMNLEEFYAPPPTATVAPATEPLPPSGPPIEFEELQELEEAPRVPWWRWAVVAAIWAAALLTVGYWLSLAT